MDNEPMMENGKEINNKHVPRSLFTKILYLCMAECKHMTFCLIILKLRKRVTINDAHLKFDG